MRRELDRWTVCGCCVGSVVVAVHFGVWWSEREKLRRKQRTSFPAVARKTLAVWRSALESEDAGAAVSTGELLDLARRAVHLSVCVDEVRDGVSEVLRCRFAALVGEPSNPRFAVGGAAEQLDACLQHAAELFRCTEADMLGAGSEAVLQQRAAAAREQSREGLKATVNLLLEFYWTREDITAVAFAAITRSIHGVMRPAAAAAGASLLESIGRIGGATPPAPADLFYAAVVSALLDFGAAGLAEWGDYLSHGAAERASQRVRRAAVLRVARADTSFHDHFAAHTLFWELDRDLLTLRDLFQKQLGLYEAVLLVAGGGMVLWRSPRRVALAAGAGWVLSSAVRYLLRKAEWYVWSDGVLAGFDEDDGAAPISLSDVFGSNFLQLRLLGREVADADACVRGEDRFCVGDEVLRGVFPRLIGRGGAAQVSSKRLCDAASAAALLRWGREAGRKRRRGLRTRGQSLLRCISQYHELEQGAVRAYHLFQAIRKTCASAAARTERLLRLPITIDTGGEVPELSAAVPLELKGVHFSYPCRPTQPVLQGLDMVVRAGSHVGVVGPCGSGKSTVLALLTRLYDSDEGAVVVAGWDTKRLDCRWLRSKCCVLLPQRFQLFDGTVRRCLLRRDSDAASLPDGALLQALRDASLDEDTLGTSASFLDRNVEQLSSGQRTLVALARCLLQRPAVLLLDEVSAHLDAPCERRLRDSLKRLLSVGTTVVSVAHRISFVRDCDQIFVMREGVVAAAGTHSALLDRSDWYREAAVTQSVT